MRFIFVGGCERSGTSLVQKTLCSHSRIAGGPEFVFTWRFADLHHRLSVARASSGPHAARLEAFYGQEELATAFRRFYSSFFGHIFAEKKDSLYLSEKTPSNIFAASQLLRLFPDSRFVHVIRDGRDVLVSHREVLGRVGTAPPSAYDRRPFSTRNICGRWNGAVEAHFELLAAPDLSQRYFWTRFEDLLRDPRRVLTQLFHFLDLELEEQALAPEHIRAEQLDSTIDNLWYTEEMYRQGFNLNRINRWRVDLALSTRIVGSLLMAANLRRLSYSTSSTYVQASRLLHRLRRSFRRGRGAQYLW